MPQKHQTVIVSNRTTWRSVGGNHAASHLLNEEKNKNKMQTCCPSEQAGKRTVRTKMIVVETELPRERCYGSERHVVIAHSQEPPNFQTWANNRGKVENEKSQEMDLPGPPFGPRYLSTATVFSPFLISPFSTASTKASSVSNVLAFPVNSSPSFPVILATAPPGAKLPFRIL